MDSREILPETETLRFLLDSKSVDTQITGNHSTIERFLRYNSHDDFEYVRTPDTVEAEILNDIEAYRVEKSPEENRQIIRWDSGGDTIHAGRYIPEIYERWVNEVDWKEPEVGADDLELVDLFSELIRRKDRYVNILVTSNPSILKNRRLLEYQIQHHRQGRMHVMTPSEASELAGIYMRRNNDFIFYSRHDRVSTYEIDFTLWYWALPRVFIQHFHADEYISSMLDRFESLLIGIDKLGEQYYRGTGNHTDLLTRYHFNNGISLLTGICDVLALHTRDKYNLQIPDKDTNLRTGGYPLLKELRNHNQKAWQHVQDHHEIIELLHTVRNDIIHQSGIIKRGPGFSFREHSETIEWQSQTIWMDTLDKDDRERFRKYYVQIDDPVQEYDPVTRWGVFTSYEGSPSINRHTQIEPYRFLKQATKELAEFADEYLRLLGHPNRLKTSADSGSVKKRDVKRIAEHGLFPLLDDIDPRYIP
jgi:hypothetical protein